LQEFLSQHKWDEDRLRDQLQRIVVEEHSHEHSIGIIDETSNVKKGDKTPGVQRQYLGCIGKQENGIVTVHLGYAAGDFHCLLDGELFLPECWSKDRERCRQAGIPEDLMYRPKTDIALELYDRAKANGVQFQWLTFDEWYGAKPHFLRALDSRGQKFVAEVHRQFVAWVDEPSVTARPYHKGGLGYGRKTPRVTAKTPQPRYIEDLLRHKKVFRDQPWQRFRVKDGEKGPQVWEVKQARIWVKDENGLPIGPWHLIVCRNVLDPAEVKYFVSNAPIDTPLETLLLVAFSRWRVERCFEDQKGEVGLDHYEGRKYVGLKRHLILSAVSYLFLSRVRQRLAKKKSGVDRVPSARRRLGAGGVLAA
jgi:SRSO17 transposase